jgi:hypothetical protein
MATRSGRRRFLGRLGLGGAGTLLVGAGQIARAQAPQSPAPNKGGPAPGTFRGTSAKGDFQEALGLAIQAAQQSAPGADRMVEWTFAGASGRHGGIAGFNELTVAILAKIT